MIEKICDEWGEIDPNKIDPPIPPDQGIFLRTNWNYNRDLVSYETGLKCEDPSLAQQQFAEDADINTIVRRFGITGKLPENATFPSYGDFTGISDYRSALEALDQADREFMALPAEVRAAMDNDPQRLLEFCSDPGNLPAMRELGLAVPDPSLQKAPSAASPPPPVPPDPPAKKEP